MTASTPDLELPMRISGMPGLYIFEGVMAVVFTCMGVGALHGVAPEVAWILGSVALMYAGASLTTRTVQLREEGVHVGRGWFRDWNVPYGSVSDVRTSWVGLRMDLFDGRHVTVRMSIDRKHRTKVRTWLLARVGARPFA